MNEIKKINPSSPETPLEIHTGEHKHSFFEGFIPIVFLLFFVAAYLIFPYLENGLFINNENAVHSSNIQIQTVSPYRGPDKPVVLWKFARKGREFTCPAVSKEGTIYIGSYVESVIYIGDKDFFEVPVRHFSDGELIALDENGSQKWSFPVEGNVDSIFVLRNNIVVFSSWISDKKVAKIYAVDTKGKKKWDFDIPAEDEYFELVVSKDGTIYCGSSTENPTLYALNLQGNLKWKYEVGSYRIDFIFFDPDGAVYLVANGTGDTQRWRLYAFSNQGGIRWAQEGDGFIPSEPAVSSNGIIYLANYSSLSEKGRIIAIDKKGRKIWKTPIEGFAEFILIGPDESLYTSLREDATLISFSPDRKKKWEFENEGRKTFPPAISEDGRIYFGTYAKWFYAVNDKGKMLWVFEGSGRSKESDELRSRGPVVDKDGVVYFSYESYREGINGRLYALNPDGKVKWKFEEYAYCFGNPVIARDGRIYIRVKSWDGDSLLYALGEK